MNASAFDYILVGGGLQSGLLVLALRHHQPSARVLLVEREHELAGNHTWSFHPQDVLASASAWVSPAVEYRWPGYQVRINGFETKIGLSYASISSQYFAGIVAKTLARFKSKDGESSQSSGVLLTGTEVTQVLPHEITTASGRSYHGRLVIDCRGPRPANQSHYSQSGYQKFWGFEIELQSDWPFDEPIVMDDRIDQSDGFRFIYSLPFTRRRVLVEDTRFSNHTAIDRNDCLQKVRVYLSSLGVKEWSIVREERGLLPMPISGGRMPSGKSHSDDAMAGGYAGGWFHAATGYSFPLAMDFAETIASTTPELAASAVTRLADSHRSRAKYTRFLNRLLFCLVKPPKRYQIFRRFYKVLSSDSIARFYSHRFTAGDAFRIVVGLPPAGLQPIVFARSFFLRPSRAIASNVNSIGNSNAEQNLKSDYKEIGV